LSEHTRFEELVLPHLDAGYNLARWLTRDVNDAEDVVQDACVRALKYMRRKGKAYIAVRPSALAEFVAKIDRWMVGTVWTTRCSNYFRAANGRVVTQWPRSARSFWGMTRRFEPTDFSFQDPAVSDADAGIAGAAPGLGTQPR